MRRGPIDVSVAREALVSDGASMLHELPAIADGSSRQTAPVPVACDWRCEPLATGHGGNHRSEQLRIVASEAGLRCVPASGGADLARWQALRRGWSAWRESAGNGQHDWLTRGARMTGCWGATLDRIQREDREICCFLWESTELVEKPFLAKQLGWKVIAAPQNLESMQRPLPRNREQRGEALRLLERELNALSHADLIYCIGDEDAWLLRGLGLSARVLPYFPPRALEQRLIRVRRRRETSKCDGPIVILGSIGSQQAIEGFQTFLADLDGTIASLSLRVIVAGVGTDTAAPGGLSSAISCRGQLDDDTLEELLVGARALLVNQQFGTGALTRVPEALVCGIPIVGNRVALRSARHYGGVYCFDSSERLRELLASNLPMPAMPVRPLDAEREFTRELRRLANG